MDHKPILTPKLRAVALAVLCLAIGMACYASGATQPIENQMRALRDAVRDRDVSGDIHIVEIDARSIRDINRWPWPRSNHARLVDRLNKAGVRQIAFDVDFSAASSPDQDSAFAEAIAGSRAAIFLPTLLQESRNGSGELIESLPLPEFAANAMTASVNVEADSDGVVRSMRLANIVADVPRPSMAVQVAGQSGSVGEQYRIDYSLSPQSFPTHSFVDVIEGRIPAGALEGKTVIVGATAIELGDRYPIPRFGVVPGVFVQGLAAETVRNGVPRHIPGWVVVLLVVPAMIVLATAKKQSRVVIVTAFGVCAVMAIALAGEALWNISADIAPATLGFLAAAATAITVLRIESAMHKARHDADTGLPNALAMAESPADGRLIATLTLPKYDAIVSMIGENRIASFIGRIIERLSPALGSVTVFRVNERAIAWEMAPGSSEELARHFAAIHALLLHSIEIDGHRIDVQLGIGVAPSLDTSKRDALSKALSAASYSVRNKQRWHMSGLDLAAADDRELRLLGELDSAIGENDILVHYQPKMDLAVNRVTAAEALVRWQHPTRGWIRPDEFITTAEENDRIAELTLYILDTVLADLDRLNRAGLSVAIAINISAKLLADRDFFKRASEAIVRSAIPTSQLIFEITESAALTTDDAGVMTGIEQIKSMGIALSLDDYGTGQSSLGYLQKFPADELKIDGSFVRNVHENASDRILVKSTIELAHSLGMKVVCEGVEEPACLAELRVLECDVMQGYLLSKPLPYDEFASFLRAPVAIAA